VRLLFAPGAGAPSTSAWMEAWAERLSALGEVVRFDYPYMLAGRRAPDRLPALIEAHGAALAGLEPPVVLIGKSMGSRVGCHLAAREDVAAVICLGYPLRAPSGALRTEALGAVRAPLLLLSGTRDPMFPREVYAAHASRFAPHELEWVEGGDHSLTLPRRERARQADADARVLGRIRRFITALA